MDLVEHFDRLAAIIKGERSSAQRAAEGQEQAANLLDHADRELAQLREALAGVKPVDAVAVTVVGHGKPR